MRETKLLLLIVFSFFISLNEVKSQEPELPYVINSAGDYAKIDGLMFDFNIGESVLVQTFNGVPGFLFSQGFLQPFLARGSATDVYADNNVLTPNNDGKNDLFVVNGLANYPGNKISIFDRAGRVVFTATDYKSDFDGQYNGSSLSEDTYYYVIDLGNNFGLVRGFISIVLDK